MDRQRRLRSFTVSGIIIGKKDYSEADKFLEIFSFEKGRFRGIAKGARKPKAKLSGASELFTFGRFTFAEGKNLAILTSADCSNFPKIWTDLDRLSRFYLIGEFLNKALPEHEAHEDLYTETIKTLEIISEKNPAYLDSMYIYKTMFSLGFVGSSFVCAKCHNNQREELKFFDTNLPGLGCKKCQHLLERPRRIDLQVLKLLNFIEKNRVDAYSRVTFPEKTGDIIEALVSDTVELTIHRRMKSKEFKKNIALLRYKTD